MRRSSLLKLCVLFMGLFSVTNLSAMVRAGVVVDDPVYYDDGTVYYPVETVYGRGY